MLFHFVKSISQFFSKFFQHRLIQPQSFRGVRMKYSMLFSFVKSKIHFFQDFFQHRTFQRLRHQAQRGINIPYFPVLSSPVPKFFRFSPKMPASNPSSKVGAKNRTYRTYRTYKSYYFGGSGPAFRGRIIRCRRRADDGSPAFLRARKWNVQPRSAQTRSGNRPAAA